MMEVNKELIAKVASVARLKLSSEEIEKFTPQLKEILETFQKIGQINTEGIKPMFHPVEIRNRLREDIAKPSLEQKDALKNSRFNQEGYFKGPKAV